MLVLASIDVLASSVEAVKALARLCGRTGSPESSLLSDPISTKIIVL